MSPSELLTAWFTEVWNERKLENMENFMVEDALLHSASDSDGPVRGPAGFRPFVEKLIGAFPDVTFTMEHVIESGDFAAGRWVATMTHGGDHMGVKATGKGIDLAGMVMVRCANGKVVEVWDQWDRLGLLSAIGAVEDVRGRAEPSAAR